MVWGVRGGGLNREQPVRRQPWGLGWGSWIRLTGGVVLTAAGVALLLRQDLTPPPLPFGTVWWWLLPALLAEAAIPFVNTQLLLRQLGGMGTHTGYRPLLRIGLWGTLLNIVFPFGMGVLLRGAWLKRHHDMSVPHIGQHIAHVHLLRIAVNVAMFLVLQGAIAGDLFAFGSGVLGLLGLSRLPRQKGLLLPTALPYPLLAVQLLALDQLLGLSFPTLYLLLLPLALYLSAMITLAPGSLGVMESLFVLLALAFDLPAHQALWLGLMLRGVHLTAIALLLVATTRPTPAATPATQAPPRNRTGS